MFPKSLFFLGFLAFLNRCRVSNILLLSRRILQNKELMDYLKIKVNYLYTTKVRPIKHPMH